MELLIWRISPPRPPGPCWSSGQIQGQNCQSDRFGPEKGNSILSESQFTQKAWASWNSFKHTISRLTSNTMTSLTVNSLSENQRAGHGGGMAAFERRKKGKACLSFCERACLAQRVGEQSSGALRVPRSREQSPGAPLSQKPAPVGVSEPRHSGQGPGSMERLPSRTRWVLGEHWTASPAAPSLTPALRRPRLPLLLGASRFC